MERELEKDLKEIEYLIYVHKNRGNTNTQSVLERVYEIIEPCAKAARTLSELEELLSRENTPEITRSPRDNDVTEYCPHCDREITVSWNVERDELEKILEEIELEKKRLVFYPDCSSAFSAVQIRTIEKIEQIICKYMSNCKRMNDGWISVEEPPKKDYTAVFAVDKHDYYFVAVYDKEHGYRTNDVGADVDNIVAYCLFNPYRPERSDNHDGE